MKNETDKTTIQKRPSGSTPPDCSVSLSRFEWMAVLENLIQVAVRYENTTEGTATGLRLLRSRIKEQIEQNN